MCEEKKTERVTLWMGPTLLTDLSRLANNDDRSLSELITKLCSEYAYGHLRKTPEKTAAANSGE